MTGAQFRKLALGMAGAVEKSHMGHPDFRVNERIFATLKEDNKHGMVKLTPEQQRVFVKGDPAAFGPESGAWGRAGCTRVTLNAVDEEVLGEAMTLAWQNQVKPRRHEGKKMTFVDVKKLALALPGVEEGTMYGTPALKVRGELLACRAINKSAEPNTLAVRVGFDARAELLEADPRLYYVTDHYVDYPAVLVRLSAIHRDALNGLLKMAWQFAGAQSAKRARPARARKRR